MSRIDGERFLTTEVGGDLFVLDQRTGESYQLGGSAGRLWTLLARGCSVQEAAAEIAADTGAPVEVVVADARGFVENLRELGLLQ